MVQLSFWANTVWLQLNQHKAHVIGSVLEGDRLYYTYNTGGCTDFLCEGDKSGYSGHMRAHLI